MQSRKDQVQAYFFVVGRLASAVVHGRPDVLQAPHRRLVTGTVFGLLLGAVVAGIFGIVGLFVPGVNTSWQQAGTIVMDEATGARYVFLGNQLRPVVNYSSARLAGGKSSSGTVVSVSENSLAGVPVGQPIGIVGAPDELPGAGALDAGTWTVCVQQDSGGPIVTLLLGQNPGEPIGPDQTFLVSTQDGTNYLVWQGKRYRIAGQRVLEALGYGQAKPLSVTPAWLNTVPQGQDLAEPTTSDAGEPGPMIDGHPSLVGQVYQVRNPVVGSDQFYVVGVTAITPVTPTGAALLLGAPDTRLAYPNADVQPIVVGPAAVSGVPQSAAQAPAGAGLPPHPPVITNPPSVLLPCMAFTSGQNDGSPVAEVASAAQVEAQAMPVAQHTQGTTADRMVIPAGSGALARLRSTPGAAPGATFLITETGMKYPLADSDALSALGYANVSPVDVPPEWLALVPTGPLLSVDGALQVAGTRRP